MVTESNRVLMASVCLGPTGSDRARFDKKPGINYPSFLISTALWANGTKCFERDWATGIRKLWHLELPCCATCKLGPVF